MNEYTHPLSRIPSLFGLICEPKVSKATATRHLTDLLTKGCLEKLPGGGRNTRYQIKK